MNWPLAVLLTTLPIIAVSQQHHQKVDKPQVLAPGYSALTFPVPVAGSYSLPALGEAADGVLLDTAGEPASLHALFGDKIVVLSFVYTACTDVNGCPLASFVLAQVQRRLLMDKDLNAGVRLITVSFDPFNDSPDVMANYARSFKRGDIDWRFLTAESERSLDPILADYDQSVIRDIDADGNPVGTMSHILRVYLIDQKKNVRNIYSPSFLHPDILIADIRTVAAK